MEGSDDRVCEQMHIRGYVIKRIRWRLIYSRRDNTYSYLQRCSDGLELALVLVAVVWRTGPSPLIESPLHA